MDSRICVTDVVALIEVSIALLPPSQKNPYSVFVTVFIKTSASRMSKNVWVARYSAISSLVSRPGNGSTWSLSIKALNSD